MEFIDEEKFRRRLEDVRAACRKDDMDLRILLGAEILYTDMTCRLLSEGRVPTLAGTNTCWWSSCPACALTRSTRRWKGILRAGFLPVVAHVERYACLASSPRRANLIKDELEGVLFQMNNSTILGGRGFFSDLHTRRLLDEGLIDITASDAHNLRERPTRMREAYEKLKEEYDGVYAGTSRARTARASFGGDLRGWGPSGALCPGAPEAALHLWLRKAAHIAVYLVEGALLFPALRGALKGTAKGFFSTVALCALIAIVDEAHKALIPGRHCSWDEAGLNVLGAFLGAFLGALLAAFLAGRCRRRAGNDAAPGE